MILLLERTKQTASYTEGRLLVDGLYFCDTLEDTVRVLKTKDDKIKGYTAIPSGKYAVQFTYSRRFRRYMMEITQVPWFTGIRIHAGNSADDTEGCVLVGTKDSDGHLIASRITCQRLEHKVSGAIARKESVHIIINQNAMHRIL